MNKSLKQCFNISYNLGVVKVYILIKMMYEAGLYDLRKPLPYDLKTTF